MMDLTQIAADKVSLDSYEVNHLFHSWAYQPAASPPRVVAAKGVRFTTEDGRERLDFSSCFVSHSIGHQDARVVKAMQEQAASLTSFAPTFSTEPRAKLAKLIEMVTPGDLSRSFFSTGGTEANEAAIKIAHQFTGRSKIVSRYQTYHGGTTASMTASVGDPRSWAQLPGAEVIRVPQPYPYRCMFGTTNPTDCAMRTVEYTDRVIALEGGRDKVAAIIVEPVTGANGVIVPPPEYFPALRAVCDKHGILLIADEVMTGFGRTGTWFAVDHWEVVPDILTLAKGLTGGYLPLGATVVRSHIGDYFKDHYFSHGATYAGHAMSCATALSVIPIYQQDNLIENAAVMGAYLLERTLEMADKHPSVGEVRGLGLFVGIELVKNRKTKEPLIPVDAKIRPGMNPKMELAKRIFELGMISMAANPTNCIALAPPLIITKDEIDEGVAILDEALSVTDAYAEK